MQQDRVLMGGAGETQKDLGNSSKEGEGMGYRGHLEGPEYRPKGVD